MPHIERGGARIGYTVAGEGPVLVLGHSLLCDGRMWDGVLPSLLRRHRVINVDFRGHRQSTAPGPFTIEDLADDWIEILTREKVEKAVLCGLSLGGMTAMRVALAAPERVAALALLDTSADRQPPWERVKFAAMAAAVERLGHLGFIYKAVRREFFAQSTIDALPGLVERQMELMQEHDPKQVVHAVRAVLHRTSVRERLGELHIPALVLVGAEDRATPRVRSERIVSAMRDARLRVIAGAGHLSAVEQPDTVARELEEFFARIGW